MCVTVVSGPVWLRDQRLTAVSNESFQQAPGGRLVEDVRGEHQITRLRELSTSEYNPGSDRIGHGVACDRVEREWIAIHRSHPARPGQRGRDRDDSRARAQIDDLTSADPFGGIEQVAGKRLPSAPAEGPVRRRDGLGKLCAGRLEIHLLRE